MYVKALDYAIRTENWELAALCLVLGAVEAVKELPPDAVEEMLGLLDWDEDEPIFGTGQAHAPTGQEEECGPRGHERARCGRRGG